MKNIPAVKGAIDASELGTTLMHEHIFVLPPEINEYYPETLEDEDDRVEDAVHRLRNLKAVGVDSIVDMTVAGLGRFIPRIQRIADRVDINILVATGMYVCEQLPDMPRSGNPGFDLLEPIVNMLVRDVEEGIDGTGICAAILKCATDARGMTPAAESCLRAVARAHRVTGVPVSTHSHAGTRGGLEQQRIFEEEGVDLSRVIIGHSGDTTDLEYLEKLIAKGSFIGMDRFGIDPILSFRKRVDTVVRLCRMGYAGRMVLSHDAACYMDWMTERNSRKKAPNWHFLHIPNDVLPAMKERGVSDSQIHQMLVENPRLILSRK